MRGDARRHTADSFSNIPFGHGARWVLIWEGINILTLQVMHWAALCPAGVAHHDDKGVAEVQAGVLRGAGGLDDQSGQHTGQTG